MTMSERTRQYLLVAARGAHVPDSPWGRLWTYHTTYDPSQRFTVIALEESGARQVVEAEHPKTTVYLIGVSGALSEAAYYALGEFGSAAANEIEVERLEQKLVESAIAAAADGVGR